MTILLADPRAGAGPQPDRRGGTGPLLTVDLSAIADNVRTIAARTRAEVMAVVKADGFGHGAVAVARTALAAGATRLGVTSVAEAGQLRAAGLTAPVLSWLNPVDADFTGAVRDGVELAVPSLDHLAAMPPGAVVHLHLDTGMARDGAEPALWAGLCRAAAAAERAGRLRVAGIMGHLSCADRPDDAANDEQRTAFLRGVAIGRASGLRPHTLHLSATAAALTRPRNHFDLVRVGAGLVGIDPSGRTALRGALTLTAPIVGVRRVGRGTPVGYGHTWRAPQDTTLALLPVGYADGLPRIAGPLAEVQVRGRRRRVAGRISMDQTVIDLGDGPGAVGEPVTVFGPGADGEPTVADWARWADSIEHEIVTGLGARLRRETVTGSGR